MKITKRKLRRIIKEEKELLHEERKFQAMLLKEEDGGMLQMAFQALKDQGPAIADKMKQWMKANPEIFQELVDEMMEDGGMKDFIKSALPKEDGGGGNGGNGDEEEQKKEVQESRRRRRTRTSRRR